LELELTRQTDLKTQQEREALRRKRELELERAALTQEERDARDRKEKLGLVKQWIAQKNFVELVNVLESVEVNQLKDEHLSGTIPLRGWVGLNNLFRESKPNLSTHQQTLARLSHCIDQLEQQLAPLKSQHAALLQTIHLASASAKVANAFQVLASSEQELLQAFQQKLASPGWSVETMSGDDWKLSFSLFEIPHLLSPLLKALGNDYEVLAVLDLPYLDGVPISLEEKIEVLYAVNLIGSKQFDRNTHNEKCGICRIANIEEAFKEQGISPELFAKIRKVVEGWKPYQVITFPSLVSLIQDVVLAPAEKLKLVKAWNSLSKIHAEACL
jgi:hypothetical protein